MKKLFFSLLAVGMLMTSVGYVSAMESEVSNDEPKASASNSASSASATETPVVSETSKTMGQRVDSFVSDISESFTKIDFKGCKEFVRKNSDYFHAGAALVFGGYVLSKVYGWFHGDKNKTMKNSQLPVDHRIINPKKTY